MAKRKLNRRQQWRIEKIQQERQKRAERKAQQAGPVDESSLGDERHGLVIANFGSSMEIEAEDGTLHRCLLRQNLPPLVVGDRVVWQPSEAGAGVVTALQERKSLLARPNAGGNERPLAANIDRILVVAAPEPGYSRELIDQYLAAAELTGVPPLLILNKIDLAAAEGLESLQRDYAAIGYPILRVSSKSGEGMAQLERQLNGHRSVFVGQSGVGKSSLIDALLPHETLQVGALSERSGLGQHTTTTSRLYHLIHGGDVIDSPGVREFRLGRVDRHTLERGFRDFLPYLGHCRFRDCRHQEEPQCALKQAVAAGSITAERLESFQRLAAAMEEVGE